MVGHHFQDIVISRFCIFVYHTDGNVLIKYLKHVFIVRPTPTVQENILAPTLFHETYEKLTEALYK